MLNHENLIQALIMLKQKHIQTVVVRFKKITQHHITILDIKNHYHSLNEFNLIMA